MTQPRGIRIQESRLVPPLNPLQTRGFARSVKPAKPISFPIARQPCLLPKRLPCLGSLRWGCGLAASMERQHQGGPMVRTLGPNPPRLAHAERHPNHIGAFDAHGRTGLDRLVRAFRRRTLAARAVAGAVHNPQTMNGKTAEWYP